MGAIRNPIEVGESDLAPPVAATVRTAKRPLRPVTIAIGARRYQVPPRAPADLGGLRRPVLLLGTIAALGTVQVALLEAGRGIRGIRFRSPGV